jgi:hypothetical protein
MGSISVLQKLGALRPNRRTAPGAVRLSSRKIPVGTTCNSTVNIEAIYLRSFSFDHRKDIFHSLRVSNATQANSFYAVGQKHQSPHIL